MRHSIADTQSASLYVNSTRLMPLTLTIKSSECRIPIDLLYCHFAGAGPAEECSHTFREKKYGIFELNAPSCCGRVKSILAANKLYRSNPYDDAEDILPDIW